MQLIQHLLMTISLALTITASPLAEQPKYLIGEPVYLGPKSENYARAVTPQQSVYQQTVLANHNAHRKNHSASNLSWNAEITQDAQVLARRCVFQHNTSIGSSAYGQNLAAGWSKKDVGAAITDGWYGEEPAYANQYGKPTPNLNKFGEYGHFTQVVWKGSTGVGCVTFDCSVKGGLKDADSGMVLQGLDNFTVCNYSPPGNYLGQFNTNVGRSLGLPPYNG